MDKQKAAHDIIAHALPLVPFDGWNQKTLEQAALAAGYQKTDIIRIFPGGAIEAVDVFLRNIDQEMLKALQECGLDSMKIRERIATAIRTKLTIMEPYREAIRKAIALHTMPFHSHHALRSLYETVDTIWYAAGDTSTDFNFYTKRLTLAGVYTATMLHWLDDKSRNLEDTWAFLDRRIADIMKIEKAKQQLRQVFTPKKRA